MGGRVVALKQVGRIELASVADTPRLPEPILGDGSRMAEAPSRDAQWVFRGLFAINLTLWVSIMVAVARLA